ncbi:LLM class flavin-dependent oxidoreductase [Subtercola frigoramans]|uniref:Alkanesulfonate monooxygenase SsuD/methylene tetrahydromethanopterin reductase-like flavin-dependent oxidoreductase (Luciferase family) n=1 Tax=Subtercola frigoramans TaxID=120298 RepID=A0ABS2L8Q6_9MICO|nr:LLM class flavin-dependent oxidoreductase [Subtercola frigoramans]MBM7473477.1 alkanesulfonate monooxygenase SsuD/methylene tetrahydromethanopterin reductase-like flavin-dependent oxidoreductase (luciferase family) [Subtercola frigoramans]
MSRLQHFGWFFGRGFGPQGWGRPDYRWNYAWQRPDVYQQSARELEQAGFDLLIAEDALSLGSPQTLGLRVDSAYGGPKHDPLLLAPYLFAATTHLGITPTVNAGAYPPYLAARQFATLQHLSSNRFGINVVTDVKSARHFGLPELSHDAAYDRAEEWLGVIRRLWHSWGEGTYLHDVESGRFADASQLDAFEHRGEYFDLDGPLNALPFDDGSGDPVVVSPGGSDRGLAFAGRQSDVQLALAPLDPARVRAYREKIHQEALGQGRDPRDISVLFVIKPEIVSSDDEVDRVVRASEHPTDDVLIAVLAAQSSDLETDLTVLDLDRPIGPGVFAQHVSQGTINNLVGAAGDIETDTLRQIATRKARKGRLADGSGLVGTASQFADFVEGLGESADNDGFIINGDLHPVTLHRMLDETVPELRRRGILRTSFGGGGLRANLRDF